MRFRIKRSERSAFFKVSAIIGLLLSELTGAVSAQEANGGTYSVVYALDLGDVREIGKLGPCQRDILCSGLIQKFQIRLDVMARFGNERTATLWIQGQGWCCLFGGATRQAQIELNDRADLQIFEGRKAHVAEWIENVPAGKLHIAVGTTQSRP